MKYELTTTPHPKTHLKINFDRVPYTIRPKTSPALIQDKIFQHQRTCSIINERLRKHTALGLHTGKFSYKYLHSYNVSDRSDAGAKQKRGNGPHWQRRWADARIIWRKYYEARRYSRCTGGRW